MIEKLTSPDINLSPAPVRKADSSVKHPGLDNHGMGTIFEELVRRFNEENNEAYYIELQRQYKDRLIEAYKSPKAILTG